MPISRFLTNQLLVAMPQLEDRNFSRTVILICEHSHEGALGIVVNRPLKGVLIGNVLARLDLTCQDSQIKNAVVYQGGPVEVERGFVIHHPPGSWLATVALNEELGLTTSRDILEALASGRGPKQLMIAFGYAGWAAGQLEKEIADNSWITAPAKPEILFETPLDMRWRAAGALIGVELALLTGNAGHA